MSSPQPTPSAPQPSAPVPSGVTDPTAAVPPSQPVTGHILTPSHVKPSGYQGPTETVDGGVVPEFDLTPEQIAALEAIGGTDEAEKPIDPTITAGTEIYFQIWGMKPPWKYIEGLVESGMNVSEIAAHELAKEGEGGGLLAKKTHYWRDQHASYAAQIAQIFGTR